MKTYKSFINRLSIVREKDQMEKVHITCSNDAAEIGRRMYEIDREDVTIYESFYTLYLNHSNNTVGWSRISQGGIAGTVVDTRLVLKYALDTLASGMILFHNHPTGSIHPSQADMVTTNRIKEAGNVMDIKLLDHIILTDTSYYSFMDEGQL